MSGTSYDQKVITGPFKGIVDNIPAPYTPPNSFDDLLNMFLWAGRLITRPRMNAFGTAPDGANIYAFTPFTDILGFLHNLVLTGKNAYFLTPGPTWNGPLVYQTWSSSVTYAANDVVVYSGGIYFSRVGSNLNNQPNTSTTQWALITPNVVDNGQPYGLELSNGRVYYSNGSFPGTYADGESTIKSMLHPGAFFFCGVLGQHMVTANTIEPPPGAPGSTAFTQRVRWSDTGNATTWTESANTSAGHQDLLDVPDAITGYATLGRNGYVFRSNGVTMMTPTGVGSNPFQFDQVSHAPKGVGVFYPNSLDVYGSLATFISEQDVYMFDGSTFTPIAQDMKKSLFADLAVCNPDQVIGTIVSRFNANFRFLSYWVALPSSASGVPVVWIYSWDSQGWMRFTTSVSPKRLTFVARMTV